MNPDPDHTHHIRRVTLPSGRSIEVVYFDPPASPAEPEARVAPTPGHEDLHVCRECTAGLV